MIENNRDVCFLPPAGNILLNAIRKGPFFKIWINYPKTQLPQTVKTNSQWIRHLVRYLEAFLEPGWELGLSGWQEARGQAGDIGTVSGYQMVKCKKQEHGVFLLGGLDQAKSFAKPGRGAHVVSKSRRQCQCLVVIFHPPPFIL